MGGEPAGNECGRCHGRTALVLLLRTGYKRAEAETPARSSSHKPGMRWQGCREVRTGQEPGHAAEGRAVLNYHGQVGGAVAGPGAQNVGLPKARRWMSRWDLRERSGWK